VVNKQQRDAARARAAEAAKRQRRRMRILTIAGAVVIGGLIGAIVFAVVRSAGGEQTPPAAVSSGALVAPTGATEAGALTVGKPDAPVTLDVYLDYMCPYCGRFERANSAELDRLVADGTVRVQLYPLSFLDKASNGTRYSTRAANAVATVADRAPDKLLAFNAALFANQPEEHSPGLTDERIAELARNAGVSVQVVDVFGQRIFEPWIATATDASFKSGIQGTPTVKIDGQVFKGDLYAAGPLTQAIVAAKGQ